MSTGVRGGQWLCAIILVTFLSPHVYSYNGGKGLWDKLTPVTLTERRMVQLHGLLFVSTNYLQLPTYLQR